MITQTRAYRRAFKEVQAHSALALKRHAKGQTTGELGRACHLGTNQIRNILKRQGGTSMTTLFDLAAHLKVSPALFFPRGKA